MTQAMNLANFSNTLDSSGGVPPSALNAPVTLAKGGTNASTASAARTNLGVDYSTLLVQVGALLFPVGSIYSSTVSTNPGTSLGFGTWTAFGAGRVMMGSGNASYLAGTTGGSADAIVPSHTHTATSTDSGHTHTYAGSVRPTGTFGYSGGGGTPGIGDPLNAGSTTASSTANITTTNASTGVSATNANLQPYIVVYMWQRTA